MIERALVSMKNCYGIDSLTHEFDFSNNNMPVLIYAPNGVMKTSLAKTLRGYTEGKKPEDIFFPERESSFSIVNQDGEALNTDSIFVIDSIDEKYQSKRISSLLASEDLKPAFPK
tara:strand:+ start:160 stop:504 length:345 start_codon:yes stop_codon:yes gene_type:complete